MSTRAPVFEVERFERVVAGRHVLLRVAGRWRAPARVRLASPVLLLDDGHEVRRLAPLPGPDDAAPVAGPDPALWRAAFAVPATWLSGRHLAYGLETNHGTVDLPAPGAAARAPAPSAPAPATDVAPPRAEARRRADAERVAEERRQAIAALDERLAAERERTEQARLAARSAQEQAQALESARASAEAQAAERAEALAAVRAELARAHEAARVATTRDTQSARALELARTIERERDHAVVTARAAAERADRTTARLRALERERDELRSRADAAEVSKRQARDLGARVAELEKVRRSLAEVADRVPELERALEAAHVSRQEVEEVAQQTAAEVGELREAHAHALERAALVERAQSESRRLVARVAELEQAARQREHDTREAAGRATARIRVLERDRDELRRSADLAAAGSEQLVVRVAELEEVAKRRGRAAAELADRVPELEAALEAAELRRREVEELAQRTAVEVVEQREAHAQASQRAALLERAQTESRRLAARVAELEQLTERQGREAAQLADRVPELEGALEAEQARRLEVEQLAQRAGAQVAEQARALEQATGRLRALERERDELRVRADAAVVAERQVRDLGARVGELEEVRRSLAEVADRVPELEAALDAAQLRRREVEELAQRFGAEVGELREAHAEAAKRAALVEQAQAETERLVARVAELEQRAQRREQAAAADADALAAERDEARAALAQAADELRAERDRATTWAQAAERRAAELQAQAVRSTRHVAALEADLDQARSSFAALEERRARDVDQLRAAQAEIKRLAGAVEGQSAARADAEALAARLEQQAAARAALGARVAELEQIGATLADRATQAELEAEFALARERERATTLDALERWPVLVLLLVAVPLGLIAGVQPAIAAALLGVAIVGALVVAAPVIHFALLIAITAIVPYEWQQAAEFGAGNGGLQLADLLLITGLARTAVVLVRRPPRGLTAVVCALMVVFMALVLAQGVHGWLAGYQASQVIYETREVLTWGTLLIAVPLLMDPRRRSQLLAAMMVVGMLVGLWGIAQWILDIPFGEAGDAGVQAGVALTSTGRGQVQGALFAFPVAVLISLAALVSGGARSPRARTLLVAILVINTLSLLLTFERSLWVATVAGALFIVLRTSAANRFKAIITMALVVLLALPVLATIAPGALTTARERLLSIGQYGSDNSVRFRIDESRFVFDRIADQPVVGSGMGATIHWGRPYDRVAAATTPFSHNSVLWLSWKLGVPAVILLLAMITCAFVPRRSGENATNAAVRHGAQATLVAMLIISVTFQSLASRPITPTLGLVLALCAAGAGGGAVRAHAQTHRAEQVAYVT